MKSKNLIFLLIFSCLSVTAAQEEQKTKSDSNLKTNWALATAGVISFASGLTNNELLKKCDGLQVMQNSQIEKNSLCTSLNVMQLISWCSTGALFIAACCLNCRKNRVQIDNERENSEMG